MTKRIAFIVALFCFLALRAHAQTTVTGTFLPQNGETPAAAGLTVLETINGTNVCGQFSFVAYNAGNGQPTALLWDGNNYLPQPVNGYVRCSDGALINSSGSLGVSVIPNTDSAPTGSLTWMQGGLTASTDGSVPATSWSEAKAIPDQSTVSWGSLPVATIVDVGYQVVENSASALNPRTTLNLTGDGVSCVDNNASNRTDCTISSGGASLETNSSPNTLQTILNLENAGPFVWTNPSGGVAELSLANQNANVILAGPSSGGASTPSFRALVAADIPSLPYLSNASGSANTFMATPNGSSGAPTLRAIVAADIPAGNSCPSNQFSNALGAALAINCAQVSFSNLAGTISGSQFGSQTQNEFFASPNGSGGSPSFRLIVAADIPTLNQSTTGNAATATALAAVPSQCATVSTGIAANGNANCLGSQTANFFYAAPNGSAGNPFFRAIVGADLPNPSATSLGGVDSYAAVAHQWINSVSTSGAPSSTQPSCNDLSNGAPSCSTDTTNASNISSGTLSAARLPNPSATTLGGIESLASTAHEWINSISTSGVPSASEPAFSDLSGSVAIGQTPLLALGDILSVNSTPTLARIAGNASTTLNILTQTGTGSVSALPTWNSLSSIDIPVFSGSITTNDCVKWASATSITDAGTACASANFETNTVANTSQATVNLLNGTAVAGFTPTFTNTSAGNVQAGITLSNESANVVFAGPSSGSAAVPTWRALVGADLPNPGASSLGGVESYTAPSHQWINAISTSGVPSSTEPAFSDLSGSIAIGQTPLTTLGDLLYANATPALTRLAGNTTATKEFLTQTGTGSVSAAPSWGTIAAGDIPAGNSCSTNQFSNSLGAGLALGCAQPSFSNLSGTIASSQFGSQTANTVLAAPNGTVGNPTFRALVGADLPNPSATTLGGIESAAAVTNEWISSINTSGVPQFSQPGFSSLSGAIALTQTPLTTNGDLLTVASGALARLGITNNAILTSASSAPSWLATNSAAGSIFYWSGSAFASLAGNASGTNCLTESSSGVPSWGTCGSGSSLPSLPTSPNTTYALTSTPSNGSSNAAVWSPLAQGFSATQTGSYTVQSNPSGTTTSDLGQIIPLNDASNSTLTMCNIGTDVGCNVGFVTAAWNINTGTATIAAHSGQTITGPTSIPPGSFAMLTVDSSTDTTVRVTPTDPVDTTVTVPSSTTINANSCVSQTAITMTGLFSTMTVNFTTNADSSGVTGFGSPSAGLLYVTDVPSTGSLAWKICNNTSSNITTSAAVTLNVSAH